MSGLIDSIFGSGDGGTFVPMVRLPQAEAVRLAESSVKLAEIARKLAELADRLQDQDAATELWQQAKRVVEVAQENTKAVRSVVKSMPFSLAPDV